MHHLSLVVKKPLALNYIELRFSLEKCCLKGGRDDLWSTKDQPKMFAVQQLWWETHLVSIARCARFRAHPCGNWCRATDNPKLSPQMADAIKTDVPTKTSKNHQIIISKKKNLEIWLVISNKWENYGKLTFLPNRQYFKTPPKLGAPHECQTKWFLRFDRRVWSWKMPRHRSVDKWLNHDSQWLING